MKLQDMLQERNEIATKMRALNADAAKEERALSSEESEKWDKMCARLDMLDGAIERSKQIPEIVDNEELRETYKKSAEEKRDEAKKPSYQQAFAKLIRSTEAGHTELTREERDAIREARAQSKGTDSEGGYLVPDDFVNMLVSHRAAYGGIEQFAMMFNTASGADIPVPTNDDTSNSGAIVAENAADSEQDTVFGEIKMLAYKYSSKIIRVSFELLQDNEFNLEAYLAEIMGERLGRAQATHFAAGTGSSQPQGLNAATSGKTAAATGAVTYDELLDLKHSLDPVYRASARWFMNDATLLAVKKLADSDGRKLWQPDVAAALPATLDGSPYTIDQGLPAMAASAKPIVFGDASGYAIRRVSGVRMKRLVELYAANDQVGFVALERCDGRLINTSKLKAMTMAAS
jgi:HK97 family phage major capsid protein